MYEANRILPASALNRAGLADAIGVSEHAVRGWLTRGPLKGFPRQPGIYTKSDVVVGRVVLALRQIMGEQSETVDAIATQVAERLWHAVKAGQVGTMVLTASANGVTVQIRFTIGHDGEITAE